MSDPFEILGLPPDATEEQIQDAFRTLCKTRHPDAPNGSHDAMAELNIAHTAALRHAQHRNAVSIFREVAATTALDVQLDRENQQQIYRTAHTRLLFKATNPIKRQRRMLLVATAFAAGMAVLSNQVFPLMSPDQLGPAPEISGADRFSKDMPRFRNSFVAARNAQMLDMLRTRGPKSPRGLEITKGQANQIAESITRTLDPIQRHMKESNAPQEVQETIERYRQTFVRELATSIEQSQGVLRNCFDQSRTASVGSPSSYQTCWQAEIDRGANQFAQLTEELEYEVGLSYDLARNNLSEKTRDRKNLWGLVSIAFGMMAALVGGGAGLMNLRINIAKEEIEELEQLIHTRPAVTLIFAEFFSELYDRTWAVEDLRKIFRSRLITATRPGILDERHYHDLRGLIDRLYGADDFLEMFLSKGVQLGLFRPVGEITDEIYSYRGRKLNNSGPIGDP